MSHSTLIVGSPGDAERIAVVTELKEDEYPHFHCGNLDAGILGQVFWHGVENKEGLDTSFRIEIVHSRSTETGSVIVHVLPQAVVERYARLTDADINQLARGWAEAKHHIRIPRSTEFNVRVMGEITRLAKVALQRNQVILVRTSFRRP